MKDISIKLPSVALLRWFRVARLYVGVAVFLLFAAAYGFIIVQINTLSSPAIDDATVIAEAKATVSPRLDAAAAKQLEALKDNSVNVQTLFEQGRTNPFEE